MSSHDLDLLGAYCLGALESSDAQTVEQHLESCPDCQQELDELREVRQALDEVPPEALLDGAVEDGDLMLTRLLRMAEAETAGETAQPPTRRSRTRRTKRWYRGLLLVAAAAVVLGGVFAGGLVTGRQTAPSTSSPSVALPAGTRTVRATDASTGVGMSIDLVPGAGWVALQGHFTGVTPGTPCEIYLVSRSGQRILAGGWVAPANADKVIVTVTGSAIIASTQIVSIEIDTMAGQKLVAAST